MAYDLSPRLFLENGPAVRLAEARDRSSTAARTIVWQKLKQDERYALVSGAMKSAA